MLNLNDLELAHIPIDETDFAADPLPYIATACEMHPWLANSKFGYVVHDYYAMKDLLRMDDKMRVPLDGVVELMGVEGSPPPSQSA